MRDRFIAVLTEEAGYTSDDAYTIGRVADALMAARQHPGAHPADYLLYGENAETRAMILEERLIDERAKTERLEEENAELERAACELATGLQWMIDLVIGRALLDRSNTEELARIEMLKALIS
jgi:hypothetical protein